jgi:uncharacterized membrane protein (UPF0127 family)
MSGQAVVTIKDKQWQVSLATSYMELVQGLSGVAQLLPRTGMLFDLGNDTIFTVTTEEMLFPIDIIRISSSLTVTDVASNVLPGQLVTSVTPARYFLEVNAGEASDINPPDQAAIQLAASAMPQQVDITGFTMALLMMSLMIVMVKAL